MKRGWEKLEVGKGGRKYYNSISIKNNERKQNHLSIPGLVCGGGVSNVQRSLPSHRDEDRTWPHYPIQ